MAASGETQPIAEPTSNDRFREDQDVRTHRLGRPEMTLLGLPHLLHRSLKL
jgi:hypothetical protein